MRGGESNHHQVSALPGDAGKVRYCERMNRKKESKLGWGTIKSFAWVMAVLVLFAGGSRISYGAESSVIENVSVNLTTTFGEQGEIPDPVIEVSGTGCSLGDVQYRTKYENWKPGKKVRLEINVNADEGKVFPTSLTRTQCKVTGADFVSARALDNTTLQVKVDYMPVTVLEDSESAGWSTRNRHHAVWKSVSYAPGYSLILYGGDEVVSRMTVETNSVDLSEYMRDEEITYYYEVKAIPITSDEKKYLQEGNFVSSTSQEIDWEEAEEKRTGDGGAVRGNQYVLPDGTLQTNIWKKINDAWYYFGADGNMVKGWQAINGFWYFMDASGKMMTGWINPNGDAWYYLYENGGMAVGWLQPEPGKWYFMDASGRMLTGWIWLNGKWYYLNPDGRMHTGWLQDGANLYYLYSDGNMATDAVLDGYYIGSDGRAWKY